MGQGRGALLAVVCVILPLKGHVRIIDRYDSMVGYGNPVCLTGKILEYVFSPAEGRLCVDKPSFILRFCVTQRRLEHQ
jgi:hypothetical protein